MSEHAHEDMKKHVRVYLYVFAALAVLTVVTVAVSHVHLGHAGNITVALLIATVKGSLVACYFMHLISEKKMLYGILILTAVFFVFVMFLPLWGQADQMGVPHEAAAVSEEGEPAHGHEHGHEHGGEGHVH
jgi:cytochrome c oxidase subunit IV